MEDSQIVALYWQRDEAAIDHTQKKYGKYLAKIAYNILSDREDAGESVNDTYLAAWNSMPPQRPNVLSAYLGKLTRRISIDLFRRTVMESLYKIEKEVTPMKKLLAILLSVLLVVSIFCACGAESASDMMMGGTGGASADNGTVKEETSLSSTGNSTGTPQLENQKLVRKVWLDAETDELDPLLAAIDQRIGELSGYVEAREVYNGTGSRSRYANITVRIPAENLDGFIDHVTQNANITSTNETVDNITLSYVATQSRITALETEQTRLLELLAMAENMEDLLKIEERLTDVRTELEEVTSQLRLYDNMVSYGTVYLNIYEVREYTVTEEPETVWERIGTGFMKSLKNLGTFFTELFIFLIVALPYLVPIALVVIVIIILAKRKKQKKQQSPKPEE